MNASTLLRIQAHANRLANHRLQLAFAALSQADFHAVRTSFFPSLAATVNHNLAVDRYYIGALNGERGLADLWPRFVPAADAAEWAERQRLSDERLIAFCDGLDDAGCAALVAMERPGGRIQYDLAGHVLMHLITHQIHHRGQVHAMLAGTAVAPPQLDEFSMPSEAHLRTADMAALGWDESEVYGPAP